jgi:DHA1 family bicyclomycin/chloramphenicol resistance-like MFS transporter
LFGYLNSSQQMFDNVFHAADFFTIGFAIIAIGIAVSNFTNADCGTFGARRVSHTPFDLYHLGALQLRCAICAKSMPLFLCC